MASIKYTGIITKEDGSAFTMSEAIAYINTHYIDPHQHYFIDDRKYWAKPHVNGSLLDELGSTYILEPEAKSVEAYDAYGSYDDAYTDGKASGDAVWLMPDNMIGSIPALIKLPIILFFLLWGQTAMSQVIQRSGLPNYIPKTGEAHTFKDTAGVSGVIAKGGVYTYSSAVEKAWYGVGPLIQESTPPKEWVVSGVKTILTTFDWYKPSVKLYYKWERDAWRNPTNYSIDSLLGRRNEWQKTQVFKDSIIADKGVKSGGVVDTKGVKSQGSATKAAIERNGVESSKDTTVNASYKLTGAFGTVTYNCTTADLIAELPDYVSDTENWIMVIRKSGNVARKLTIVDALGDTIYETTSNFTITVKNTNTKWKRISVAIY